MHKGKMKILLVNPTRTGADWHCTPPLHLMYLKKALKHLTDCSCEIIDVNYEINKQLGLMINSIDPEIVNKKKRFEDEHIKQIAEKDFDILGIGGIVPCYDFSERLVEVVLKIKPRAWIIVGGGLGMPLKDLWFETKINFLVESDAEVTLVDIVKSYPDKNKVQEIKGVYHRDGNTWEGSSPNLPTNLDYIDPPDWEDTDYEYSMNSLKHQIRRSLPHKLDLAMVNARLLPVIMTRGCPYHCTFCFHFNRLHRKHSIEYLIDYFADLKKRFDINTLYTWDELIITDRTWFIQLCEALKKKSLGIQIYMGGGKPNLIDKEMLEKMREAGVIRMSYGIESGSPTILKEMKKMVTVEENYNAVKWSIEAGIFTHSNIVLGMPSESEKTLKETRDFLMRLQKDTGINSESLSFAYATAYPGTELFEYAVKKGFVSDLRRYVLENKGAAHYMLDFCGLGELRLKKFTELTLIKMDYNELRGAFNLHRAGKLFLFRIPKFIVMYYFPKAIVRMLKKIEFLRYKT